VSLRRQLDHAPWLLVWSAFSSLLRCSGSWWQLSRLVDPLLLPTRRRLLAAGAEQAQEGILVNRCPGEQLAACLGGMPLDLSRAGSALRLGSNARLVCQLLGPLLGLIRYMPAYRPSSRCDHLFRLGELRRCLLIFNRTSSSITVE